MAGLSYEVTSLAHTGDVYCEFAPYVPCISETGVVAFQAKLVAGGTGIVVCESGHLRTALASGSSAIAEIQSHPAINSRAELSFYAAKRDGGSGVFLVSPGQRHPIAAPSSGAWKIGPLGPTMNEAGAIAFRARDDRGIEGVYTWQNSRGDALQTIARAGEQFAAFDGLPVIVESGAVAFRSQLRSGESAIYMHLAGESRSMVDTRGLFSELGRFPDLNHQHRLVFVANKREGGSGVFALSSEVLTTIADTGHGFESFRGVLAGEGELSIFYATPEGGALGIYCGPDPSRNRVLGIGDPLGDSRVRSFALNPVSMNSRGQLAIRVELDDGQGAIVRADPPARPLTT